MIPDAPFVSPEFRPARPTAFRPRIRLRLRSGPWGGLSRLQFDVAEFKTKFGRYVALQPEELARGNRTEVFTEYRLGGSGDSIRFDSKLSLSRFAAYAPERFQ